MESNKLSKHVDKWDNANGCKEVTVVWKERENFRGGDLGTGLWKWPLLNLKRDRKNTILRHKEISKC